MTLARLAERWPRGIVSDENRPPCPVAIQTPMIFWSNWNAAKSFGLRIHPESHQMMPAAAAAIAASMGSDPPNDLACDFVSSGCPGERLPCWCRA